MYFYKHTVYFTEAKIYTDMHCMLINQFKAILFETLAHQRGIMMNM